VGRVATSDVIALLALLVSVATAALQAWATVVERRRADVTVRVERSPRAAPRDNVAVDLVIENRGPAGARDVRLAVRNADGTENADLEDDGRLPLSLLDAGARYALPFRYAGTWHGVARLTWRDGYPAGGGGRGRPRSKEIPLTRLIA